MSTFADLSLVSGYASPLHREPMNRGMPHPEAVSREHIDATVIAYLKAEKDLPWTEIALVTLHPREEIRIAPRENADKYRGISDARFRELLAGLKAQSFP